MYKERICIFLSCSETFKEQVAYPIRDALDAQGLYGLIVSDEPLPPDARDWDPDSKVEYFLANAEALVALCTPDDWLEDGTVQSRPNIVDELQRARSQGHLRPHIQVLKERRVKLHSNINPTYNALSLSDSAVNIRTVLDQLAAWGFVPEAGAGAAEPQVLAQSEIAGLTENLQLGDHDGAERRILRALVRLRKSEQATLARDLIEALHQTNDQTEMHVRASLLEALHRFDPQLVSNGDIDRLARNPAVPRRICAAMLMWERATSSPSLVPIDTLLRLAIPSREDWYVFAPAVGAARDLLLRDPRGRIVVETLRTSHDADDRREAAQILADVAQIDPGAVSGEVLKPLLRDRDAPVREVAEACRVLLENVKGGLINKYSRFGL